MLDLPLVERKDAKERGLRRFFTGNPCKRGHVVEREAKSGKCVECERLRKGALTRKKMLDPAFRKAESRRARIYNLAHPEQTKRNRRTYRARHIEHARAKSREWHKANPERVKALLRRFHEANPGKQREYDLRRNPERYAARLSALAETYKDASRLNRRSRVKATGTTITQPELDVVKTRARGRCANCGKRRNLEFDHIQPIARGGAHVIDNLQMLCRPCNQAKRARDPIEWARANGRLC